MSEPIWSFSQAFSTQFQTSRSELEARANAAKSSIPSSETLQSLSLELAKLTNSLADATGSIPNYDQKQYEIQLRELENTVESLRAAVPKSRFAFKRKATPAGPSNASAEIPVTPVQPPHVVTTQPSSGIVSLSSHSWKYLTKLDLSGPLDHTDLSISDLDHCIVNLLDFPMDDTKSTHGVASKISALHVRNLSDSVLILPVIEGSVLLHDIKRCTIVLGCHQFRMHTSQSVDAYLRIPSNPIIEHCERIRFSGYPESLFSSGEVTTGHSFFVQDFSHIRSTPSPNWVKFPGISEEWPLHPLLQKDDIQHTLSAVLPS